MNVNLYGCQGKWIMCDLGMTFSDPSVPGTDLILPDLAFVEEHRDQLLGIVLTHGHEDHIGAIPFLAADLDVPLYATPFTAGLIWHKLDEEGLVNKVKLNIIPMGGRVELGPFDIRYVELAHSIPEGNALVIDTPYGRLFHTGDWKLDEQPLMGKPASEEKLRAIGDNDGKGVLALVGDSTNVMNHHASGSETGVYDGLMELIKGRKKGRVLVTTFASNAARLHSLGEVAKATGRQLVVAGRSLDRIISVAQKTGYLKDFPPTISIEQAAEKPAESQLIVATGSQGESRAALARIAEGRHPIKLQEGDLVVFSSWQIPGNELAIGKIQNRLAEIGVELVDHRQAPVHVSGHPGRPELRAMYDWIRPEISVPVHGERRHMEAHARLAQEECGVPKAIVPANGDVIRLAPDGPLLVGKEHAGRLVLDGDVIVPVDSDAIRMRRKLSFVGIIVVSIALDKRGRLSCPPAILAQGLPLEDDEEKFLTEAGNAVEKMVKLHGAKDERRLIDEVKVAVRRVARHWTGKKPVTEVQILGA